MKVEVVTPEDYVGNGHRRPERPPRPDPGPGDRAASPSSINAMVPLANMFKYVDNLRSMSQGRAQYTMQFDHYEPVPTAVAARKSRRNTPKSDRACR
jgi:elongation factor G